MFAKATGMANPGGNFRLKPGSMISVNNDALGEPPTLNEGVVKTSMELSAKEGQEEDDGLREGYISKDAEKYEPETSNLEEETNHIPPLRENLRLGKVTMLSGLKNDLYERVMQTHKAHNRVHGYRT